MTQDNQITRERPAVTFGLIAYNQEKYVGEAIQAAFDQKLSPLEIILSDDCSNDGTFAIMEQMAAAYRGPHTVIARREPINVGTVRHMIHVSQAGSGELLVIAAGDDVSHPDRSSALYDAWKLTGAAALDSWHDEIDSTGAIIRRDVHFPPSPVTQKVFGAEQQAQRIDGQIPSLLGSCAAYPIEFWANLPEPPVNLLVEDGIATSLVIFRGQKIHRVPQSLLSYRLLDSSLSVRSLDNDSAEIRNREAKMNRVGRLLMAEIDYTLALVERENLPIHAKTLKWMHKGRRHGQIMADFWAIGPIRRVLRLKDARMRDDLKFLVPRLLGFRAFAALRRIAVAVRRRTGEKS